jgi:hypothetical protein
MKVRYYLAHIRAAIKNGEHQLGLTPRAVAVLEPTRHRVVAARKVAPVDMLSD